MQVNIDLTSAWEEILYFFRNICNFIWITFADIDDGITLFDLLCAGVVLVTLISAFTAIFNFYHGGDVDD